MNNTYKTLTDNFEAGFDLIKECRNLFRIINLQETEKTCNLLKIPSISISNQRLKARHFHHFPELFIQLSGKSILHFPEQKITLLPENICIVPKLTPHEEQTFNHKGKFYNLVFAFNTKGINFHLATMNNNRKNMPLVIKIMHIRTEFALNIVSYMEDIITFSNNKYDSALQVKKNLVGALFSCLDFVFSSFSPSTQEKELTVILHCKRLVANNFSNVNFNVNTLAKMLDYSADYISNLFSNETGIKLNAYINQIKINAAQSLLKDKKNSISEVSYLCGFSQPSYFTKVFKKYTGKTPEKFRDIING